MAPFIKRGELSDVAVLPGRAWREWKTCRRSPKPTRIRIRRMVRPVAPTGRPRSPLQKLNRDVNKVLADAEVSQRLHELGAIYDGPERRGISRNS